MYSCDCQLAGYYPLNLLPVLFFGINWNVGNVQLKHKIVCKEQSGFLFLEISSSDIGFEEKLIEKSFLVFNKKFTFQID